MITQPYKLTRCCEVTAILILYGLPRYVPLDPFFCKVHPSRSEINLRLLNCVCKAIVNYFILRRWGLEHINGNDQTVFVGSLEQMPLLQILFSQIIHAGFDFSVASYMLAEF